MSDEAIRRLSHDGEDEKAEREWIRRGLGWFGETLPVNELGILFPTSCLHEGDCRGTCLTADERRVYTWFGGQSPVLSSPSPVKIQFVYVPGGKAPCKHPREAKDRTARGGCLACDDAGYVQVDPFYIGRFPVTEMEWFQATTHEDAPRGLRHLPASPVTRDDCALFCERTGLRLPSIVEWHWAVLGAPRIERRYTLMGVPCVELDQPEYPWGNEPPTQARCASMVERVAGDTPVVVTRCDRCGKTCHALDFKGVACCRDCSQSGTHHKTVPARPDGASWCGAIDTFGYVYERVNSGLVMGGPRRPQTLREPIREDALPSVDQHYDVGFRVALSAV